MARFNYQNIKAGDIYYECSSGCNLQLQAITQPYNENGAWQWKAIRVKTGDMVDYLITEGYEGYGPKLYSEPQYVKITDNGIEFNVE